MLLLDAGVNFDAHLKPALKCVGKGLSKIASITHWTGAPTNPSYKIELRKMTYHLYVRNAKIFRSDQLQTYDDFSLSYIRWGMVGTMVYSGSSRRIRKKPHVSFG